MGLTAFSFPHSVHYGQVFVTGGELNGAPPAVPLTISVYVLPLTTVALPDGFTASYPLSDHEATSDPPQYNESVALM